MKRKRKVFGRLKIEDIVIELRRDGLYVRKKWSRTSARIPIGEIIGRIDGQATLF